jgi:deoxyxylulose-5-phosphate synthase
MRPVVAIYSTFLQRAYDQILHDVVLQHLPVLFCIDRAGVNASDGATHDGIYDLAFLSHMQGLDIYEPPTTERLSALLGELLSGEGLRRPVAVRYPSGRDHEDVLAFIECARVYESARGRAYLDFDLQDPPETIVITHGRLTARALMAATLCADEVGIIVLEQLKGGAWDDRDDMLSALCQGARVRGLVICEEGVAPGIGDGIADLIRRNACDGRSPEIEVLSCRKRADVPRGEVCEHSGAYCAPSVQDILRAVSKRTQG